nr:MAG: hypothetical protein [Microviridae sp.]
MSDFEFSEIADAKVFLLYSVYDSERDVYGTPLCFSTDIEARRWFIYHLQNDPILYANREKFTLFKVASFLAFSGEFTTLSKSVFPGSHPKLDLSVQNQAMSDAIADSLA